MTTISVQKLGHDYLPALRQAFRDLALDRRLKPSDRILVKPNLTFPHYREGVMTHPDCVRALVVALKDYTSHITIGESDGGGYNRFSMEEVFAKTGLQSLASEFGVRIVNLSHAPRAGIEARCGRRRIAVPVPALLLDGVDMVISAAVPKIHMNTLVSMTVKNLWGLIPEPSLRLRLHPYLDDVLFELIRHLPACVGLVDGRFGLNRSGPLRGDAMALDWFLAGEDLYATDWAACRLIQVDPRRVTHLSKVLRRRGVPLPDVPLDEAWRPFLRTKFTLRRAWTDYPGAMAFRSPLLAYLAYRSPLSNVLHRLLYLFREPFYDYKNPADTR